MVESLELQEGFLRAWQSACDSPNRGINYCGLRETSCQKVPNLHGIL